MKIDEAIKVLEQHASDYAAASDLREAVKTVSAYFNTHPVVDAEELYAALERSRAKFAQMMENGGGPDYKKLHDL